MTKREEARIKHAAAIRYKRPVLMSLGWESIREELEEMQELCDDVRYAEEDKSLLQALDGDIDEEREFRFAFSDLSAKTEILLERLKEHRSYYEYEDEEYGVTDGGVQRWFDDRIVALIGDAYKHDMLGFDFAQEDYYHLTEYQAEIAKTEAGKRIMRDTKAEMLASIGQCMGIVLSFVDLRNQYYNLRAAYDVLMEDNKAFLNLTEEIDKVYAEAEAETRSFRYNWGKAVHKLDRMIDALPQRCFIE